MVLHDYPEWGDIVLFKVPSNNHHLGLQMVVFSPCMELVLFCDWMVCVRFYYHKIKVYVHYGGWRIQCDKYLIDVQNALASIMATIG